MMMMMMMMLMWMLRRRTKMMMFETEKDGGVGQLGRRDPKTGTHSLREPAQPKRTWTFEKSHLVEIYKKIVG